MVWNSLIWWYLGPLITVTVLIVGAWMALRRRSETPTAGPDQDADPVLESYR